ncbi:hypothetical protein EON64_16035, partial [archaeon]
LTLARRVHAREVASKVEGSGTPPPAYSSKKVFQFILEALGVLSPYSPLLSLKLFLLSARGADACQYPPISYEFLKEGLLLYEMEVSDSREQVEALGECIGCILTCTSLSAEDYAPLITKVAQYANKLLKKADQCKMLSLASLLFWHSGISGTTGESAFSDPDRVLECMQRALKIASTANPLLFVELLDRYLFYFEKGCEGVQVRYVSGLIALIQEQFTSDPSSVLPAVQAHYMNTLGTYGVCM